MYIIDLSFLFIVSFLVMSTSYLLLHALRFEITSTVLKLTLSFGFGYLLVGYIMLMLGHLALLTPSSLRIVFAAIGILAIPKLTTLIQDTLTITKEFAQLTKQKIWKNPLHTPTASIVSITLACNLFLLLWASFTPPVGWDALNYHLNVPKIYLANNEIINFMTLEHSHYPLSFQFQSLFLMGIGSDVMAQGLQFFYFIGLLVLIWEIIKTYDMRVSYLWTLAILFSIPVVLFTVPEAHIEIGAAFYTVLALRLFLLFREKQQLGVLLLAAGFIGYLAGSKYTNLHATVTFIVLLISLFILERGISITKIMITSVVGLIAAAPWYLKTYLFTGNPFWPFFRTIIPSAYLPNAYGAEGGIPGVGKALTSDGNRILSIFDSIVQNLLKPFRLTFLANQTGGDQPKVGPLLLGLLPTLKAVPWKTPSLDKPSLYAYIGIYVGIFTFIWLFSFHSTRYLVPIFPLLAILLMKGTQKTLFQSTSVRILTQLIIIGALGISTLITVKLNIDKVITSVTATSKHEYYQALPHPLAGGVRVNEYMVSEFANQELNPETDRVLVMEDLFGYFLTIPFDKGRPDGQSKYDYSTIRDKKDALKLLRSNNVTHIMTRLSPDQDIQLPIPQKNIKNETRALSDKGYYIFRKSIIQEEAILLHTKHNVYLYEIQYE